MTENDGEEETKIPCRRIQNNLYRYPTLKEVESKSPFQKAGLCMVTSFREYTMEGGCVERNFIVET